VPDPQGARGRFFCPAAASPAPSADFNHSGSITIQDNFDFHSAYFTACA